MDVEPIYRLWPYWTSSRELTRVTNALLIATDIHKNQIRKYNGNPYLTHVVRVALAISSYPLVRLPMVCAAFLHDTREDLPEHTTMNDLDAHIRQDCGEDVLEMVIQLTNVKVMRDGRRVPRREQKQLDWERLSKTCKEVKIIKMFDRQDNLKEMVGAPVSFKKLYVEETLSGLLPAVRDGDDVVAQQLEATCRQIYDWQRFSLDELLQKPIGTVFEYFPKVGDKVGTEKCWIVDRQDNSKIVMCYQDGHSTVFIHPEDCLILLRETGESK